MSRPSASLDELSSKLLRKRKPFRLLAHMSETEVEQFQHFLESRHLPTRPDPKLQAFFACCRASQVWASSLDKAGLEAAARTTWTDNAFDKLVSKLYAQLIAFAATQTLAESPEQHTNFALPYFEQRGIDAEEFGKKLKEGRRDLDQVDQNEDYYRLLLDLELQSAERSTSRSASPDERGLVQLHTYLDSYHAILKLRLLCASVNEQPIYGSAAGNPSPALLNWFAEGYEAMPDLAKVYFHALHVLLGIDDKHHVEVFKQMLQGLPPSARSGREMAELYGYLLNYYARRLNQGDLDAMPQMFHFYTQSLFKGWILEGGRLAPEHFKNLMVACCRMEQAALARDIFDRYKDLLTDTLDGAVLVYNEAVLEFYEKNYGSAVSKLEGLTDVKAPIKADHFYGIDARCMLLKAYFEMLGKSDIGDWDVAEEKLLNLLHAFQGYITRKDLPKVRQVRFENFRKAVQRLHVITYASPLAERKPTLEAFLRELHSSSNLPDKGWLVQQAQAIIATCKG